MDKATKASLLAGPAGAALALSLWMDWWGGATGWDALGWLEIGVLLAAAGTALVFAIAVWLGLSVSLPVAGAALTATGGLIAGLFVLHRLINSPFEDAAREAGLYLALAACIGLMYAGRVGMQEEDLPASASPA
jgi:hypothetical protein